MWQNEVSCQGRWHCQGTGCGSWLWGWPGTGWGSHGPPRLALALPSGQRGFKTKGLGQVRSPKWVSRVISGQGCPSQELSEPRFPYLRIELMSTVLLSRSRWEDRGVVEVVCVLLASPGWAWRRLRAPQVSPAVRTATGLQLKSRGPLFRTEAVEH